MATEAAVVSDFDPTLTDEELAVIEARWSTLTAKGHMPAANEGPRLIAALRASRGRETELVEEANEAARLLARIGAEREKELAALRASRENEANWRTIAASFERMVHRLKAEAEPAQHRQAMRDNPGCEPCRRGVGTVAPGPGHKPYTAGHRPHCGCDFCW